MCNNKVACYDSTGNYIQKMYQWDANRILVIKSIPVDPVPIVKFAFCDNENSIPDEEDTILVIPQVSNSNLIVSVPNEILERGMPVFAFIYESLESIPGDELGIIQIPVIPRIKPAEYEYIEE